MLKRFRGSKGRVALVPNQWSGSVQQYYHFLLGYLAPTLLWLEKTGSKRITVRDCGPMNRWFDRVLNQEDVEIMQVGHFLHVFAGNLQPCEVLRGMDFPDEFSAKDLARFRNLMLQRLGVAESEPTMVSVLDRATTDSFYFTAESEIDLAGAARRSTPNLHAWVRSHESDPRIDYFDSTDLDIDDQVLRFTQTKVLIGQHGAGLANMVLMRPGGVVVEIQPPLPAEAVNTFRKLAQACGQEYIPIPQSDVHADVDFDALDQVIRPYL